MPYREPDEHVRERRFAIQTELAEIRRRTRELIELESKKKILERELLLLTDPKATNAKPPTAISKALKSPGLQTFKQVAAFSTIMFLKGVAVVILLLTFALVAIRMFGPQIKTQHPVEDDVFRNVPHG